MAAMEAHFHESKEPDATRIGRIARLEVGHKRSRCVVELRGFAYERGIPKILLRRVGTHDTAESTAKASIFNVNRRMRNRTSGGVGGRGPRGPLLPDPPQSRMLTKSWDEENAPAAMMTRDL